MIKHRKELDEYMAQRGNLTLPDDFTVMDKDAPKEAWQWFLKSGVSAKVAQHYRFGYSNDLARVVMPVWDVEEKLVAVQSRAIYANQKPKYLNKTGGDKNPIFQADYRLLFTDPIVDALVITEDILSCVRVGRFLPAWSTMGTHLSDCAALESSRMALKKVLIWYDGDEAGIKGANKASRSLTMLGVDNGIIKTEKDPKDYNNEEINLIIGDALND